MQLRTLSYILYAICAIPVLIGFNKLFVYDNPDSYLRDSKNAYVGGDAYNYIINAGQATAYFALATLIAVIASALFIVSHMNKEDVAEKNAQEQGDLPKDQVV